MSDYNWRQEFHKVRALNLDYEMEIKFLNKKIESLTKKITELEAQIPKPKKIKWVVCGNYEEYRQYRNNIGFMADVILQYVNGPGSLKGYSNPEVDFIGNWIDHPQIIDIITQIKIATR